MDKKLQRIVGVLIVLALAVVLSPLLFGKDDGTSLPTITTTAQSSSPASDQAQVSPNAADPKMAANPSNNNDAVKLKAEAPALVAQTKAVATPPKLALESPAVQLPVVANSNAAAVPPKPVSAESAPAPAANAQASSNSQPKKVESTTDSPALIDKNTIVAAASDDDAVISSVIGADPDDEVLPQEDGSFNVLPNPKEGFDATASSKHIETQDNLDRVKTPVAPAKQPEVKPATDQAATQPKLAAAPAPSNKNVETQAKTKIAAATTSNVKSRTVVIAKGKAKGVAKAKTKTKTAAKKVMSKPQVALGKTSNKAVKPLASENKKNIENIKKAAWAIQLGSFKNKMNAVNLTNKLRAAGYTAFTREINSKSGSMRIVYIGPESKRNSALTVSKKLQQDLKIQGIIVSYKPLAL